MRRLLLLLLAGSLAAGCGKKRREPDRDRSGIAEAKHEREEEAAIPPPPDVAAAPSDAEKTASGLVSKRLQAGTGSEHPEEQDSVTVRYTGWTTDGKMFDTSTRRDEPTKLALRGVIKGWTEGLKLMVVGEKRRFWIPKELAYGDEPDKPKGTLVFDVELVAIEKGPKPIAAPPDVAAAPADAQRTASGIAWKILTAGAGARPRPSDAVRMHYTAWSVDGKMMDSTVARGAPLTLWLDNGPPGLKEALPLMQVGEKRRFWFPKSLVVHEGEGPAGDVVCFDIELLGVVDLAPPADLKPPPNAERTPSGLASLVLKKGTGSVHPQRKSVVRVDYTGWTSNGKIIDSSLAAGKPAEIALGDVLTGWAEGVELMVEGEKRRIWIPEELANKGRPGPQGTLTFDIELLQIVR